MPDALIPDSGSHGNTAADYLRKTLARYGVGGWTVDVRDLSASEAADVALAEGYSLISRSKTPPGDKTPMRKAWEQGRIPYLHGIGTADVAYNARPRFGEGWGLYLWSDLPTDDDPPSQRGPGLEVTSIAYDDDQTPSYNVPTIGALLIWLYETRTDATAADEQRWLDARALLRRMATRYDQGWDEDWGYGSVYGAEPGGSDTYSQQAQEQVDRAGMATAGVQPPMDVRATDKGDGEILVEWLPYRSSAYFQTVIERGGEEVYYGDQKQATIAHLPGAGETLTLRSQDTQDTRSRAPGYATLDLSSYSYVPTDPPRPTVAREGREVGIAVNPVPYAREVDVSTSLGSVDGTASLPAGEEEVTHTLASKEQSARYRVAVLAADGSRLGTGPWRYVPGKQDTETSVAVR
jgi:hypothetical protein